MINEGGRILIWAGLRRTDQREIRLLRLRARDEALWCAVEGLQHVVRMDQHGTLERTGQGAGKRDRRTSSDSCEPQSAVSTTGAADVTAVEFGLDALGPLFVTGLAPALLSIHTQDGASSSGRPSACCVGAAPRETAGRPLGAEMRGVTSAFDGARMMVVVAAAAACERGVGAACFGGTGGAEGSDSFGFRGVGEPAAVVAFESEASSLSVMECSEATPRTGWDMENALCAMSIERALRGNTATPPPAPVLAFLSSWLFRRAVRNCETRLKKSPVRSWMCVE